MTVRVPPRLATWLLKHLGPSYRNESLAGDLHEEYQLSRTPNWYWRQVMVAICIGRVASIRHLLAATRRNVLIKQLLRVFAMIALGAATLTWASAASHLIRGN
jgi:hypothetical protein